MSEIRVKTADGWQALPSHEKTSTGWKDIPTHTMTATGWQGELTSQSPLEFRATGQSLLDWRVEGKTSGNLLDWSIVTNGKNIAYDGSIEDYQSRIATTTPIDISAQNSVILSYSYISGYSILAIIALYANGSMISRTTGNTSGTTIDTSQADEMLICFYDPSNTITKDKVVNSMLTAGSTALPYEPYGGVGDWDETEQKYKIPVTVNGTTTNLYTDHQLLDGDSIDYTTDQTAIPLATGNNVLTVDTAVQPKSVFVKFEG